MIATRVGYAGGTLPSPTYTEMGDHSETVEVTFDPSVISYSRLLGEFFSAHDPRWDSSVQYRSAIFVRSPEQRKAAEFALKTWETAHEDAATKIEEAGLFTPAEDYHQKWYLRHSGAIWSEFRAMYPDTRDLVRSTAAARVNGWIGENVATEEAVRAESGQVGLSEGTRRMLLQNLGYHTVFDPGVPTNDGRATK